MRRSALQQTLRSLRHDVANVDSFRDHAWLHFRRRFQSVLDGGNPDRCGPEQVSETLLSIRCVAIFISWIVKFFLLTKWKHLRVLTGD
jgi:hypothetical protein